MTGEILSLFHRKVLGVFASIEESRAFYFTRAMALSAYHLHHRLSEDIDMFCPEENLIPIMAVKFSEALTSQGIKVETVRSFGSFWEGILKEGKEEIRFQLAYDTQFRLGDLSEKDGIYIHGLDDLAAGKMLALFARSEERDFIDVYFLVRENKYTVEQLVELARRKDPGMDDYYLALAFEQVERLPDDSEDLRLTLFEEVDMLDVKAFFKKHAVEILARCLPHHTNPDPDA